MPAVIHHAMFHTRSMTHSRALYPPVLERRLSERSDRGLSCSCQGDDRQSRVGTFAIACASL